MIYWTFAAVGIGLLPVVIGFSWLVLHYDYQPRDILGRGDLLFLATVLSAGGLGQVFAGRSSPLLDKFEALKALLISTTAFLSIVGAVLYAFAFVADWTRATDFDYGLVANGSVIFLMAAIVVAGCCTFVTQHD